MAGAELDAATIRADGNPENASIDLYYGRLMWWAKGRVIVNYNLANPSISDSLTETMGTSLTLAGPVTRIRPIRCRPPPYVWSPSGNSRVAFPSPVRSPA